MELLTSYTDDTKFNLDPITKIIVLVILSFIAFSSAPLYVVLVLVLIPFICLILYNKKKAAIGYILLYAIAQFLSVIFLENTTGALNTAIVMFTNIICRMLPSIMMGYYVITSTKVSEFIASMERINVPEIITIPLSVMFRYFPTLFDEVKSIIDAMKMRGIGLNFKSLKSPLTLMEYLIVPILMSAVKTSDELSAASLTRGLSNPKQRTNICNVSIDFFDIFFILISIVGLGIFAIHQFGGF
ncbi:energy-coupling factor transporter transmembrane component T [Methanobrevibacter sp. DSM 116169]|uniref:energy-coupling factor transporter transmembrane component T n=1 Tax=Methanobrevibacter sp. DSM 116169 TaxID=3242727 RepID=UPI0038FC3816